jgi:hypothetical protein
MILVVTVVLRLLSCVLGVTGSVLTGVFRPHWGQIRVLVHLNLSINHGK